MIQKSISTTAMAKNNDDIINPQINAANPTHDKRYNVTKNAIVPSAKKRTANHNRDLIFFLIVSIIIF